MSLCCNSYAGFGIPATARAWIYSPFILTYSLQGADASFGPFAVPVRRSGQSQGT